VHEHPPAVRWQGHLSTPGSRPDNPERNSTCRKDEPSLARPRPFDVPVLGVGEPERHFLPGIALPSVLHMKRDPPSLSASWFGYVVLVTVPTNARSNLARASRMIEDASVSYMALQIAWAGVDERPTAARAPISTHVRRCFTAG